MRPVYAFADPAVRTSNFEVQCGRGERIRTSDPSDPNRQSPSAPDGLLSLLVVCCQRARPITATFAPLFWNPLQSRCKRLLKHWPIHHGRVKQAILSAIGFLASHGTTLAAFVGWLLTAVGWYASARSQRRGFVNQVRNEARRELVIALRGQQSVLGRVGNVMLYLRVTHESGATALWDDFKWLEQHKRYQDTFSDNDSQWIFALEQYEVLFPETRECRHALVERSIRLSNEVSQFFSAILYPASRATAVAQSKALWNDLGDQGALIEDLLVHIQNATLGAIVKHTVPFRVPLDPKLPRIVAGKRGQLAIVNGVRPSL